MKEKEYIGNRDQLFNIKRYMYSDGKRKNVEAIELQNSNGLDVTILVDKCLDIYQLKYKGKNLNFITPTGIVNPYFYNTIGDEWINSWEGGFLTTCGLNNIGMSCIDEDKDYGLHGKIHNTPAEQVNINVKEIEDDIICIIEGKISQSYMFGENLVIKRKYICSFRKNKLFIEDNIMNNGYKKEALMMLYHFNIGYPLLSEYAKYVLPSMKIIARDEYAQKYIHDWEKIESPQENFREMCYYHKLKNNVDGSYTVGIDNNRENLFLRINYNSDFLDKFVQWKMFGKGEYVSGLEPCSSTIDGRANARFNKTLKFIEPKQTIFNNFCITISDDKKEVASL